MSHILAEDYVFETLEEDIVWYRQSVHESLAGVERQGHDLNWLATKAYTLAALLVLAGRASDSECGDMMWLAGNAEAYALYLALFPKGAKELEVLIPKPPGDVMSIGRTTTGPTSSSSPGHWFKAFYLTLLWEEPFLKEEVLMRSFASTFAASSTKAPAYRTLQVEAAQAMYTRSPDAMTKILAAFDAMQAPGLDPEDQAYSVEVAQCEAGMMARLVSGDEAGFNDEVRLALERHIKHYRQDEAFRNKPVAWVCLPALGLSALAQRRGLKVSVQSPLLPLELISN
ncbi:immunity 49 family protein [Deinococcus multiflagellatus]|uniref:Immunity 49 family protein n=1 Tax=Deinococcus multiflagellatus TaxID=1656887 RepID=A0ABW1ZEY6_9DEIO|nr:immunity 49 family protein [Deinococcus multiflagellatus]MBZ9712806.1 immunity 49 family protein [Deinococcus multiflagellatus]